MNSWHPEQPVVLVVDDSPTVCVMVGEILAAEGYVVRQAGNGTEALEEIAQEPPDLVLLDIMMPGMDGFEACREIRKRTERLPILMFTAHSDDKSVVRSLDAGADDFVTKPFNSLELIARVRNLVRVRRLQTELMAQNRELEAKNHQMQALMDQLEVQNGELAALNEELDLLARTDPLTKAYNRRHLFQRFEVELSRAKRHQETLACALLDMDHFKSVNDSYDHQVGDEVLERLVEVLRANVRAEDVVARYGGEEFVLLLPETTVEEAHALVDRIRDQWQGEEFTAPDGTILTCTVSAGISGYIPGGDEEQTPDAILRDADAALHRAKNAGRNRVAVA